MKRFLFAVFAAAFLLPCVYAQNYPLLSPDFIIEEEIEKEPPRTKINTVTLYWEGTQAQGSVMTPRNGVLTVETGGQITLTLRTNNWFSQQPLPAFFMPPVPQGMILSALTLSAQERAAGIAAKFKLIPLAAGDIILPARTLLYENTQFNIPLLRLQSSRLRS